MSNGIEKRSLCSTFVEKLKNTLGYFGDNSTLHGVRYVLSLSYIPFHKRVFWLLILLVSVGCAGHVMRQVLQLYSGGSVSYLIETDYLEFDTPFPAVTICEQVNAERVNTYIKQHKLPPTLNMFLKDVVYYNAKVCKICASCKPNQTCIEDFYGIVKAVRSSCSELLTDCWWDDKPFKCCDRFLPIETEYGVCFVFNSRLTGNETAHSVNRKIGLPNLVFSAIQEVGIRVHSPDDMVSVGMENSLGRPVILPLITDFEVILKAEVTLSDKSVNAMPPRVRGCLFKDERPPFAREWPFKRYSYSTCMLYCRAVVQADLCNCTHHLMPKIGDVPLCNIQGLVCLSKSKESLGAISCNCPMSCDEVTYKPVHMFTYRHTGNVPMALTARGTRGLVRLAQLPASRVRRAAIRHTLGLVVDIGGVGGVFFGASLLNVIEIIYLLCIRRKK
ncbi:hypothetical protein ABMA27_001644 [Loxostege sticticalis]|uniref:Sodium channel protein Nach n=1 Tax=Loxostege sticticalis TaxID=481309 RepID=A0ABR3HZ83_LOXSC